MCALGNDTHKAVLAAEQGEDLRSFAVLDLAEADGAVGGQRHRDKAPPFGAALECSEALNRAGLEPATYGLKVRCSTN